MFPIILALTVQAAAQAAASKPTLDKAAPTANTPIEEVTLAPLYRESFMCSQHWEGQLKYVGDALGQDCMITGGLDEKNEEAFGFAKLYRTDGSTNEDWYGWKADLLAPFDGVVKKIKINPVVNRAGYLGKPPASMIIFERADGTDVLYAHVQDVKVKEGDKVTAGQPVAKVGNNGFAHAPHTHVGAWRGETPLQIRWDLRAMAKLVGSPAK
jgi:murein DD-endopeptidase MepM/ murein hydrolase activator NlpD